MTRGSRAVYVARPRPRRPLPKSLRAAILLALGLAVLALAGWYALTAESLRIASVEVKGARQTPAAEIEQVARDALGARRWGILPAGNFFSISTDEIGRRIREGFPGLEGISAHRVFPDKLVVSISERELWGVYCQRPDPAHPPRACAYLDRRGTAYVALSGFSGWLLPVIYGSEPAAPGSAVASESLISFYAEAGRALDRLGERLLLLTRASSTPEDARLGLDSGWTVWVSVNRPVAEWSNVLATVLSEEIKERSALLEYVDLRFGRKVFYKFK